MEAQMQSNETHSQLTCLRVVAVVGLLIVVAMAKRQLFDSATNDEFTAPF